MRILVTGAGGFVGKRLVQRLADAGHSVLALIHTPTPEVDAAYFARPRVECLTADLETFEPGLLPGGIDAMVLLAQSAHFREFPLRAGQVFNVNVVANLRLLDWAVGVKVKRVVLASSGGIYGGKLGVQFHETDSFPVNSPLGFYLGSKVCSEIVAQNYRQFFESMIIIRPFFIYGPRQRADMFVTRIMQNVRDGREISLQGADGLRVNPIYVDDAVMAFARALERTGNSVVNVAGADMISLRDLALACARHYGREPVFRMVDGDPVDYVADISVARSFLGLQPRPFLVGLQETFDAP